jgi:hypothetical protein
MWEFTAVIYVWYVLYIKEAWKIFELLTVDCTVTDVPYPDAEICYDWKSGYLFTFNFIS